MPGQQWPTGASHWGGFPLGFLSVLGLSGEAVRCVHLGEREEPAVFLYILLVVDGHSVFLYFYVGLRLELSSHTCEAGALPLLWHSPAPAVSVDQVSAGRVTRVSVRTAAPSFKT